MVKRNDPRQPQEREMKFMVIVKATAATEAGQMPDPAAYGGGMGGPAPGGSPYEQSSR